jgi:hypothetical protein
MFRRLFDEHREKMFEALKVHLLLTQSTRSGFSTDSFQQLCTCDDRIHVFSALNLMATHSTLL